MTRLDEWQTSEVVERKSVICSLFLAIRTTSRDYAHYCGRTVGHSLLADRQWWSQDPDQRFVYIFRCNVCILWQCHAFDIRVSPGVCSIYTRIPEWLVFHQIVLYGENNVRSAFAICMSDFADMYCLFYDWPADGIGTFCYVLGHVFADRNDWAFHGSSLWITISNAGQ